MKQIGNAYSILSLIVYSLVLRDMKYLQSKLIIIKIGSHEEGVFLFLEREVSIKQF